MKKGSRVDDRADGRAMVAPPIQPLTEVFGFPAEDVSASAEHHRRNKLCPFHDNPCTKEGAKNPLGICSNNYGQAAPPAITCPVRLKEDSLVFNLAAEYFFGAGQSYEPLPEIPLHHEGGLKAGNIDFVPARFDADGTLLDWGALELQTVYMSYSNQRTLFNGYMKDRGFLDSFTLRDGGRPDWRSSSKKRLVPQLIEKAPLVIRGFGKRFAVAVQPGLLGSLPRLPQVAPEDSELAIIQVDLVQDHASGRFRLTHMDTLHLRLDETLRTLAHQADGDLPKFEQAMKRKRSQLLRAETFVER